MVRADQAYSDSLYNANHPRLLFDTSDIPYLYNKVRDGGYDSDAYNFIRLLVDYIYPGEDDAGILGDDYGITAIPMLGLATYLESPEDEIARSMGLSATLYLASQYDVDNNDYDSSLRLRSLALGYDLFFTLATEAERQIVIDEILAYTTTMLQSFTYTLRQHRPYLSNRSVMYAAALGLTAIVLDGEADPVVMNAALKKADDLVTAWQAYLVDVDGAYSEGVTYAGWSMKHLVYYFAARKRFDGFEYGVGKIRKLENWLAYELMPEGNGKTNNINDTSYFDDPLPRHHTFFDWAQTEWQSGLSAWMYEHIAGPYGWDWGIKADKPATVLWNLNLPPIQPDSVLPNSYVWEDRGLYYTRTGWQSAGSSEDLVFSFYSGLFHGGHAQQDQNNFTLYGYGAKFAIDHGGGGSGRLSASHNMVFVDGKGQHNAGNSIGTDGQITRHALNEFADFVQGDATAAYATYSPLNNPNYPFTTSDWSWGYSGSNPVLFAIRDVIAVHGDGSLPPYFLIVDEIDKDGATHNYQWRLHTHESNTVDTTGGDTRINAPTGRMILQPLNPAPHTMARTVTDYDNLTDEPDSKLITFTASAVNPHFSFLMLPGDLATLEPSIGRQEFPWGTQTTVSWGAWTDIIVLNHSGGLVDITVTGIIETTAGTISPSDAATASLQTDARVAVLRYAGTTVSSFVATQCQALVVDGAPLVFITDGPASVVSSGRKISLSRVDAQFQLYGPDVTDVNYRRQKIHFVNNSGFLSPDPSVGAESPEIPARGLRARVFPNPFNPATAIVFELDRKSRVSAVVYDPLGRQVKVLADGEFPAGPNRIAWDGIGSTGGAVPSGVYFVKLVTETGIATLKLTVLK